MKPIFGSLKNSEEILKFMNELSHFSEMFSLFNQKNDKENGSCEQNQTKTKNSNACNEKPVNSASHNETKQEKNPSTATEGIADEFIERCLQNYFKNR